ncbi:tetratricopeptide repeat protein, partial [Halorhodospira sp. 9622]|uniref:tetratricopeptide repeat protein n=1 Tax=Halorhodospira sp. 9622 TaxID=2899136 RepID=UPI001EE83F2C
MDKGRTNTASGQRRALALALVTGFTALGLLTNTGCYVPPDDGIARTDTDPQEQQNEQTEEQQQEHERSPWDELDQPPISSAPEPEQDPEEAQAAHQEANQLAKQGREALEADDPRQAVEYFEQAVNHTPNRAVLWQNLAAAQLEAGNYAEAETSAQRALDLADARDEPVIRESLWL